MTAAIFGLIGVIIGAVLTGGLNYALQVRLERREVRAVARLMLQELSSTGDLIRFALDRKNQRLVESEPIEDEWKRHHLLLARHLSDDDWDTVALGYGESAAFAVLVGGEDVEQWRDDARMVLDSIDSACDVLRRRAHRKGWEQPDL